MYPGGLRVGWAMRACLEPPGSTCERRWTHTLKCRPGEPAGMTEEAESVPDERRSKVGRVVAEYDLAGLPAELESRWTAPREERSSLRDLADDVNRRVLEAALRDAGRDPLPDDVDAIYRALASADAGAAERTRRRRDLERDGIDVDALQSDFVSHQAVHTYLTKYRDAEHRLDAELAERSLQRIRRLQGRTTAVTEDTVERLVDRGEIAGGDLRVILSLQVLCETCGTSRSATDFIENGGCDCGR